MSAFFLLAAVVAATFENPVIRTNWPDPTFWQDGAGSYYGVASGLAEIRMSRDWLRWEPIGPVESASCRSNLNAFATTRWAPDFVRIGDEYRIYVTQFVTSDTNRLVCLSSKVPTGPFEFRSVILDNRDFGIRDLAIDSEVVADGGRVWLFTGSVAGGVHRFELTADGLALKTRTPVHVAGLLPGGHDRKWIYSHPCYEGSYLYRRDGWWYLFVSAGSIAWDGYRLCCGRARTLDGDFVDSKGVSLAKGGGNLLLVSNETFPGPGHNGEIFTDGAGRDYMFFHSHWSAFPQDFIELQRRCLNLQRIHWGRDGWPFFETGSVKKTEDAPVFTPAAESVSAQKPPVATGEARTDAVWVRIAAADSRKEARLASDFACTGTNDEATIQRAIDLCKKTGKQLFLFAGLYRLGSVRDFKDGGPKTAVCIRNMHREFAMVGERRQLTGWPKDMKVNGVILYLQPEALAGADGKSIDILRGEWSEQGIMNGSGLRMENLAVYAPDSQHPLRAVDLQRICTAELRSVSLRAFGAAMLGGLTYPYGNPPPPHPESIGITLTDGSNNAPVNLLNVSACGFGQGFQVGGEHVVMVNCSATFGGYGFTFGNYPYHCAFDHPITLINCCDEQNINLPLFNSCGDKGGALHGRQEVSMISFNCERLASHAPGKKLGDLMREVKPGTWRGNIGFTRQPKWCAVNSVDEPIWAEDGSGTGFVTRNNAHRPACCTAERLSYYPQYMQQVYDTDLNKLLICTDPAKRVWRDAMGRTVQ